MFNLLAFVASSWQKYKHNRQLKSAACNGNAAYTAAEKLELLGKRVTYYEPTLKQMKVLPLDWYLTLQTSYENKFTDITNNELQIIDL